METQHVFHSSKLPRVLVVDDNDSVLNFVRDALAKNYCVRATTSANEALEIMPKQPYEIVITDIVMPEMSGWELISKIHALDLRTAFIVITGNPDAEISKKAEKQKVFGYIEKPFDPHLILRTVDKAWNDALISYSNQ